MKNGEVFYGAETGGNAGTDYFIVDGGFTDWSKQLLSLFARRS
jgi:hypothetical protein